VLPALRLAASFLARSSAGPPLFPCRSATVSREGHFSTSTGVGASFLCRTARSTFNPVEMGCASSTPGGAMDKMNFFEAKGDAKSRQECRGRSRQTRPSRASTLLPASFYDYVRIKHRMASASHLGGHPAPGRRRRARAPSSHRTRSCCPFVQVRGHAARGNRPARQAGQGGQGSSFNGQGSGGAQGRPACCGPG
jgi:hypothetical protein